MTVFRRAAKAILFVTIAVAVLVFIGTFIFFTGRGQTPSLTEAKAVASLAKVKVGGADQWLLIRGHDSTKPVLLFLHGGPGMPAMFLAHAFQRDLERYFVVVHWDRRGVGKSAAAPFDPERCTVRQVLDDTAEVVRLLRVRFQQDRVYLVGHSWGTYLALLALREHPEYYAAYVGVGQMAGTKQEVHELQRQFVISRASESGDAKLADSVQGDGPVTEEMLFRYHGELLGSRSFLPILLTGLCAPEYTFGDALRIKPAASKVNHSMKYDVNPLPLAGEVPEVSVPVFFFLGRHDFNTPSVLAEQYLSRLNAPLKSIVWFEHSAHFAFFEEPAKFTGEMLRVQTLAKDFWRNQ